MSYTVMGRAYRIEELKTYIDNELAKAGTKFNDKMAGSEFLCKTMDKFGSVLGDHFVIIENQYWEEYDPFACYGALFERYYEDAKAGSLLYYAPHEKIVASTADSNLTFEGIVFPGEDD